MKGMKVAAFACGQWDRAEVMNEVKDNTTKVKLFFIDYGTSGNVNIRKCKLLFEDFAVVPRQAIRAGLYGIKPKGNTRLWNLSITHDFVTFIRNKSHEIEIVKYHDHVSASEGAQFRRRSEFISSQEDFYEFLLYDTDGNTVNQKLLERGVAEAVSSNDPPPSCLSYPSFNMLEKFVFYPTYAERFWMLRNFGVDFNGFEEVNIPQLTNTFAFEVELTRALSEKKFAGVKEVFMKLIV